MARNSKAEGYLAMSPEDETRPGGIKGQCLSSRSRFLVLWRALSSSCAGVHQNPRAVAFVNSEGRFRRLFHVEQRRIPLRCLLSDFRDKFCSLGSLTPPPLLWFPCFVSVSRCLFVRRRVLAHAARRSRGSRYSWEESAPRCCEQQVSRAPWMVGGHPPFIPRVTSTPPPLHCTGIPGVSLNNIGERMVLKTDSKCAVIHGERDRPSREKSGTIIIRDN